MASMEGRQGVESQTTLDELPEGWDHVELADHVYVAGRIGWRGLKAEEYTPSGPILLSVPNLNYGDDVDFRTVNHISPARYDESPEIQLQVGDTLLVKDGAGIGKLGYVAHLPAKATVNSSLLVVRPTGGPITNQFLLYYLKGPQFQDIALRRITGSTTPHLFQKDIRQFRVLVPPVPEQLRIVGKARELLAQINDCRERLSRVPKIIKAFRQSVLAAACSGRLTEDWREGQPEAGIGAMLLERISAERRQALRKEAQTPAQGSFSDTPPTRRAASVDQIISEPLANGRSVVDRKGGFPVLRLTALKNGRIDLSERKLGAWTATEARPFLVKQGDFLVSRGNGSLRLAQLSHFEA